MKGQIILDDIYEENNQVIIKVSAKEPLSLSSLAEFLYDTTMRNLHTFIVGQSFGLKTAEVLFTNSEGTQKIFRNSRNWTSKEGVMKDICEQITI